MRRRIFLAAAVVLVGLGGALMAAETPDPPEAMPDARANMDAFAAPACAGPALGTEPLRPGCCQCQPNCCDDVWAGYCQEKKQGLCVPCLRPLPLLRVRPTASGKACQPCEVDADESHVPVQPEAVEAVTSVGAAKRTPTTTKPGLRPLPPPPENRPVLPRSTSGSTDLPIPMFNPAAWKIGSLEK